MSREILSAILNSLSSNLFNEDVFEIINRKKNFEDSMYNFKSVLSLLKA